MVMTPPHRKNRIVKLQMELAYLQMKKKILGKLSEKDEARTKEIMMQLSIKY